MGLWGKILKTGFTENHTNRTLVRFTSIRHQLFTCAGAGIDKLRRGSRRAGWVGAATLLVGSQEVLLNHTSHHDGFIPGHFHAASVDAADSGGRRHALRSCERVKEKIEEMAVLRRLWPHSSLLMAAVNQTQPLA